MNLTEKLKIAMIKQNVNQSQLADLTGQAQHNLSNKMIRDNYKLSEYKKLVEALNCQLEINIILPDGTKI